MSHFEKPRGAMQPPGSGRPPPPPPRATGNGGTLLPELGLYQDEPWRRLLARVIDWAIVLVPVYLMWTQLIVIECHSNGHSVGCSVPAWRYVVVGLAALIVTGAYFIGVGGFLGSTVGKLLFGLRVVQQDGIVPDGDVAVRRGVVDCAISLMLLLPLSQGRWVFAVVLGLASLAGAIQLFHVPRQVDFYDQLAGTYVVRT
jgi:uncharacterized RDD family membrane protein YckC